MLNGLKLNRNLSRHSMAQCIAGTALGVFVNYSYLNGMPPFAKASKKKIVRVFLNGGLSHVDSFDPKPNTPEVMGNTKVIKSNTGEEISSFFPMLAKRMHRLALIRSMIASEGDHSRGQYLIQYSYPILGTIKHPGMGAWMQKLNGVKNGELPASVNINSKVGPGFLGEKYSPFSIDDASNALEGLIMEDPGSRENLELMKLMSDVRMKFHKENKFKKINAYAQFYNESIKLMYSKDISAFDINLENGISKSKYKIKHGDSFLLARRLLEADVQCISIGIGGWDNHVDLWADERFPTEARSLDKALAVFMDDLIERGMFDDVILTVNTEFGRTPNINVKKGRDHHRKSYSSIIAGAGVKPGVYGKTDEKALSVIEDPVRPKDFNATLAFLAGLDLEKEIFSPDNRPFKIASNGKVISGIIE